MSTSVTVLDRKAVKAALNQNWAEAAQLNEEILEINPNDTTVKLRLGKAYLQLSEFPKAKKIFKEVLKTDPINPVAKKNYELASSKKADKESYSSAKSKIIIKEPGKTTEVYTEITDKSLTAEDFEKGEDLELKILKKGCDLYKVNGKKVLIGTLPDQISAKLYAEKSNDVDLSARYIDGSEKKIQVLIVASEPVFKSQKQEVKPYVKQSNIESNEEDED